MVMLSACRKTLLVLLCGAALSCSAFAAPVFAKPTPQKPSTTTVPFDYDPVLMPYIVVQASINGHPPLPFVVDTGTYGLYLDIEPWAAKQLALPSLGLSKYQFTKGQGFGHNTVECTWVKTVKLAGVNKNNVLNFVFNTELFAAYKKAKADTPFQIVSILSPIGNLYRGPQLAGIVSLNLLQGPKSICQIDFQRKCLVFIQSGKGWKPTANPVAVPLHRDSVTGLYSLSATVGLNSSRNFEIDTGSPVTAIHHLAALPVSGEQSVQGLFKAASSKTSYDTVLLSRLQIGSLIEQNVYAEENSDAAAAVAENLLGLNFLSRFLVTLDFADNKMYLKHRSDYAKLIVPPGRANVRLEKQGTDSIAAWVQPGSPAALAGLHTGDQIIAVDGQRLEDVPLNAAQNLLDGQEGTRANLQVVTTGKKNASMSFTRSSKFLGRRHALLGVSVEWVQGYLMVAGVTPGSPLDGTLKFDDDIDSINGQSVSKMTMDDALRLLERPDLALQVWRSSDKTWQEVHIAPLAAQTQVLAGPPPAGTQYRYYDKAGWTAVPLP